jgi:hypothetical protein
MKLQANQRHKATNPIMLDNQTPDIMDVCYNMHHRVEQRRLVLISMMKQNNFLILF